MINMSDEIFSRVQNQSRLAFGLALAKMAETDPLTTAISADSVDLMGLADFIERYPDRFIDVGIAEQNAMGIASGLATTGMRPFVCGYAPFITARSMEQLRNDVAYANQRVVIGAAASGVSLGVSGGTHHALEDLALMRAFPNITAIVPADARQAWATVFQTQNIDGPVYIRLGSRIPEEPVSDTKADFQIGKAECLREGNDITIIACGCLVSQAIKASQYLSDQGIGARVLNMHTIKPLDRESILTAASETKGIVTAEEHRVTGGLGSAIAELLSVERPTPMRIIGLPDEFAVVGPTPKVREGYGLTSTNITNCCMEILTN